MATWLGLRFLSRATNGTVGASIRLLAAGQGLLVHGEDPPEAETTAATPGEASWRRKPHDRIRVAPGSLAVRGVPSHGNSKQYPQAQGDLGTGPAANNTFSETIDSGSTLIAGWNEQYDRWELLEILRPGARWAKAQSDWEENAGDPRVLCNSCNRDGSGAGGTSFYVYLPRSTSGDPAIFQDAVLAYAEDPDGVKVCVSDYMDDKIGAIKLWRGAVGDIPEGWRLCDGTSGAFDPAGRFPLGVDPGGRSDEDTIGDTGGHRWHGQTENNHPAHPNHRHAYDTTSEKVDAGQDGTEQAWDASPTSTSWTSGVDYLEGESGEILGHYGPYNSDEDTDNRSPYRVVAFVQRWK